MRAIAAVAAGLLLCAAPTACTTTVATHGEFAPGTSTTQPTTTSASPTPTTSPTPTPTPTPVRYDPGRRALTCRGGTVLAPRGGPYCYLIPAGMRDVTGQVKLGAGTGAAKFVTSVGLAGRDLIVVMVYRTPLNTDLLPDGTIIGDLRGVLASLTRAGFVFASRVPRVGKVDRARAFTYHARSQDSSYQSDLTFIFRGRSQIEVLCQYANNQGAVQRACRQLLGTLQIRTVS
jgi:hypothetical protein